MSLLFLFDALIMLIYFIPAAAPIERPQSTNFFIPNLLLTYYRTANMSNFSKKPKETYFPWESPVPEKSKLQKLKPFAMI